MSAIADSAFEFVQELVDMQILADLIIGSAKSITTEKMTLHTVEYNEKAKIRTACSDGQYRSKRRRTKETKEHTTVNTISEKNSIVNVLSSSDITWLASLYAQFKTVVDFRAVHGNQFEKAQAKLILEAVEQGGISRCGLI